MIFEHTCCEKDLWRGWLRNGQSVELSRSRHGWDFGFGVHVHSNEDDQGDRMLFLKFFRYTAVIPLGFMRRYVSIGRSMRRRSSVFHFTGASAVAVGIGLGICTR